MEKELSILLLVDYMVIYTKNPKTLLKTMKTIKQYIRFIQINI